MLLYTVPGGAGAVKVGVRIQDEAAWRPQKDLAELFGVKVPAINKHLKSIYESGELERGSTISRMEIVQPEGGREVSREVEFYNLDACRTSCTGPSPERLEPSSSTTRQMRPISSWA